MKEVKLTMKWDIGILNKLIGLIYKKNQYITIFNLRNLQKLINNCDFSIYQNKSVIIKRVEFIKRSLEGKLDHKFADESIIINYAREDIDDPVINDIINNLPKYKSLNHSEIMYLNNMVEDKLQYGSIRSYINEMTEIIERIDSGEYKTYAEAYLWVDDWVNRFKIASRQIKSLVNNSTIRFNDPNIKEKIDDILAKLGTSDSQIITGVKMLNEMLGGAYRSGKLVCYAALPANFKSGLLLKNCVDAVKYNKSFRGRKDSHRKAVVYFTMENTNPESFERLYNMTINSDNIINHDSKYIEAEMRRAGIIGNDDIELIMVYRPNRSISTNDLRQFIEELDDEGIEVIMMAFDYIKRIKPGEYASTEKEELKNVTNELRAIAEDFDIVVVTAAQLNRQAAAIINAHVRSGKPDALKEIDSSLIGSAWEIMENSDVVMLIGMQRRKKDGALFLSFLLCKARYYKTDMLFFNQPFDVNVFNLVDDILMDKPQGVISLASDFEDIDFDEYTSSRGRKNVNLGKSTYSEDQNIFDLKPLT